MNDIRIKAGLNGNYARFPNNGLPSQYSHIINNLFPKLINIHLKHPNNNIKLYVADPTYPFINLIETVFPFVQCIVNDDSSTFSTIHFEHCYKFDEMVRYVKKGKQVFSSIEKTLLFISRKESKFVSSIDNHPHGMARRSILNEDELINALRVWSQSNQYNFVCLDLEEISFAEQVELFSSVDIVVAQHGAGLINVLWSDKQPLVIELYCPPHKNWFNPMKPYTRKWIQIEHTSQHINVDVENVVKCLTQNLDAGQANALFDH